MTKNRSKPFSRKSKTAVSILAAFALLVTGLCLAPPPAQAADVIRLTYSGFMPPTHLQSKAEAAWCKEIAKRTNGRVVITHYPGQTLTKAKQNYEGVVAGMSDIGTSVLQYTRGRFPLMDFINLPLGYPNGKVACAIINEVFDKFKPKELDETKVLYLHAHGPGFIHVKGKAVHKMEDLKGLKIRSHGPTATMVKCLGGIPLAFPMPELYQSLQKGVVQGGLFPFESNKGWKLAEVTNSVVASYSTAYSLGFYVAMNKAKWESLPADIQKIFTEVSHEWVAVHGAAWEQGSFEGIIHLLQKGNSIIGIGGDEAARWVKAVQPVINDYLKGTKERGLPGDKVLSYAQERLNDARQGKFKSPYLPE